MSKCDIEIVLDREDRVYRPGDTLSGVVGITVNTDLSCRGLTIAREWRTHGQGNRRSGGREVIRVGEGTWTAGERHITPFTFTVPEGPVTYHGHYVNVDWYIEANVDVPWAFDPNHAEEFQVLPPGDGRVLDHGPLFRAGYDASGTSQFLFAGVGILFVVMSLFFLAVALVIGVGGALVGGAVGGLASSVFALGFSGLFSIVPVLMILVGLGVTYLALRSKVAERKLGEVTTDVGDLEKRAGDPIEVRLAFTPTAALKLGNITARLEGRERATRGSGTHKHTSTHPLHTSQVVLTDAHAVSAGEPLEVTGLLHLPADAAPSFSVSDNRVVWQIVFTIDITSWPDWERVVVIGVNP